MGVLCGVAEFGGDHESSDEKRFLLRGEFVPERLAKSRKKVVDLN